ncbi:MAG: HAD family phosphatase [Solirubrobacteraceae bacterium]
MIFDLDGVLIDSEQLWNRAKESLVRSAGGRWREDAPTAMMGMSSREWTIYLRDQLGVQRTTEEINQDVVERIEELYRARLPLLPGAVEVVRTMTRRWPLGLASSSNRQIIDLVLEQAGLSEAFAVTVSSEEVARGKPAPDVYVETVRRLGGLEPHACVAVEDSGNGLRAAAAAGMPVIAVPNLHYPPDAEAVTLAGEVVTTISQVTPELVKRVALT